MKMKKLFIKTISLMMAAIIILSAFAGCDKSEANSKIMYSNLASQQVLNKLTEMMTYADISDNRQNILLEHIKQFNSIVSPDSLAAEFEEYNPEKAKYDPYDLQDEWNEKSPDFMGYNCRITAFSLFREFLEFSVDSEIRDEMIVLDLYASSGMQPCIDEQNKLYFVDGLHPNDAGHEKLAKIISHFFETQLP
jgi:hypothetical protein